MSGPSRIAKLGRIAPSFLGGSVGEDAEERSGGQARG
jgi:hypothetical protein